MSLGLASDERRAVYAEKWPEAQAERVAGVHVFSSQEGRNHPPRLGSFFYRAARPRVRQFLLSQRLTNGRKLRLTSWH
jgi:hypothetical protein